jgi:hypothetical protein
MPVKHSGRGLRFGCDDLRWRAALKHVARQHQSGIDYFVDVELRSLQQNPPKAGRSSCIQSFDVSERAAASATVTAVMRRCPPIRW